MSGMAIALFMRGFKIRWDISSTACLIRVAWEKYKRNMQLAKKAPLQRE